jgi:hypothetical protein
VLLPDIPAELIEALPAALDMARQDLEPGDPGEVMAALSTLASRRGFPLPEGLALEMDVEAPGELATGSVAQGFSRGVGGIRIPEDAGSS